MFSLIRQLIQLIPERTTISGPNLSTARFEGLYESRGVANEAVSLFEDLLKTIPPHLKRKLDVLQYIQKDLTTEESQQVDRLIAMLRKPPGDSNRVIKILFTTDGLTPLLRSLQGRERLDLNDFEDEDRVVEVDTIELRGNYTL